MFRISCRFFFRSGNAEHPSDKFYNTTIEILPVDTSNNNNNANLANITSDGYLIVGKWILLLDLNKHNLNFCFKHIVYVDALISQTKIMHGNVRICEPKPKWIQFFFLIK